MWNWSSTTIAVDGGGVGGGIEITMSGLSECRSVGTCQTDLLLALDGLSECLNTSYCEIGSIGTRSGLSECRSSGSLSLTNGLTVVQSGISQNNVNLLEFSGNLTLSSSYSKALISILAGSGDATMVYATRIDFVDATTMYKGEATVGTLDSEPLWRIQKMVTAVDDDVTITWADGNAEFDNIWNNRASLTYS